MKLLIVLFFSVINIQWIIAQSTSAVNLGKEMHVLDVVERQNNLWIASDQGLFRVNKTTLKYEHFNTKNSPLPNNHIETLSLDNHHNLWIGTYDLALLKITPRDATNSNNWEVIYYPDSLYGDSLPDYKVYSSGVDKRGCVWLGTDIGLINYNTNDSKWDIVRTNCPQSDASVWDLKIDNDNLIINIASYSLLSFDIEANLWNEHKDPSHASPVKPYRPKIVQPNNDNIFYFLDRPKPEYIFKLINGTTWESWAYSNTTSFLGNLPTKPHPKTLTTREAPNGRIYYNTNSRELVFYNGNNWYLDNFAITNNIDMTTIEHFYIDNNGDFWLFEDCQLVHYNGITHRSLQMELSNPNSTTGYNNSYRIGSSQTGQMNSLHTKFDFNNLGAQNSISAELDDNFQLSYTETNQNQPLNLTISPNPTSNFLYLEKDLEPLEHLKIVNSLGATVMEFNHLNQKVINISSLPNGSYWIIAVHQEQRRKIAFIKTN